MIPYDLANISIKWLLPWHFMKYLLPIKLQNAINVYHERDMYSTHRQLEKVAHLVLAHSVDSKIWWASKIQEKDNAKIFKRGTEQIALSIRCLLYKCENLCSIPNNYIKKLGAMLWVCKPGTEELRQEDLWGLLARQWLLGKL